jgi:hypothetical protein
MKNLLFLISLSFLLFGCSKNSIQNKEASGKNFPEVSATLLTGENIKLPAYLAGASAVVFVGYIQNSQFDIDRWILGLNQVGAKVRLIEVPTIQGMIPSLIRDKIDNGMRSGIPQEDWPLVATVYDDADKITQLTGTERPLNARVFLLDKTGKIVWFYDRGYSATYVLELAEKIKALN